MKERKWLKVVIVIIIILFLFFIGNIARKTYILTKLAEKAYKIPESENYYHGFELNGKNYEQYKKGNKLKTVISTDTVKETTYDNGKIINTYTEKTEGKTARMNEKSNGISSEGYVPVFIISDMPTLIMNSLVVNISTDTVDGKEYYVIESASDSYTNGKYKKMQFYVDKETGAVPMTKLFYDNGNTQTSFHKYEFGKVTEDEFIEPDIKDYEIINNGN